MKMRKLDKEKNYIPLLWIQLGEEDSFEKRDSLYLIVRMHPIYRQCMN